ncbi:MAG: 30S ribosomal protein S5 [Actinobacteria bacterium]|nr:30S ribosomal protein S5 [Actinomycetota bacterium]
MAENNKGILVDETQLEERVVFTNRVAKVTKGGRRFKMCALVVVGNRNGIVGVGYGKGSEMPIAIRKAIQDAKKNLFRIPMNGSTISHEIVGEFKASKVLMKPAAPGTGIIAGGPLRHLFELAGIKDILAKSLGSSNQINVTRAAEKGLRQLFDPSEIKRIRTSTRGGDTDGEKE